MSPFEMIKAHLSSAVPFATFIGVSIDDVGPGHARASLPFDKTVSNHIGTPHAGAVFTLGEAASGAAMAGAFAEKLLSLRPVAAEATIRYLKVAKGALTAQARIEESVQALDEKLRVAGKVSFPVEIGFTDETGAEIAAMTVQWHVSPARR